MDSTVDRTTTTKRQLASTTCDDRASPRARPSLQGHSADSHSVKGRLGANDEADLAHWMRPKARLA